MRFNRQNSVPSLLHKGKEAVWSASERKAGSFFFWATSSSYVSQDEPFRVMGWITRGASAKRCDPSRAWVGDWVWPIDLAGAVCRAPPKPKAPCHFLSPRWIFFLFLSFVFFKRKNRRRTVGHSREQ